MALLVPPLSYSVMLILFCTPTSRILRKMGLMANQHDKIWFWALKSLRLCFGAPPFLILLVDLPAASSEILRKMTLIVLSLILSQDGAHVQKITNEGCSLYVSVRHINYTPQ